MCEKAFWSPGNLLSAFCADIYFRAFDLPVIPSVNVLDNLDKIASGLMLAAAKGSSIKYIYLSYLHETNSSYSIKVVRCAHIVDLSLLQ